jgi:branched-chain amino acid transport system substrate-binding protein
VVPAEQAAKGYNGLALEHSAENNLPIHKDIHKYLYDKGKGTAAKKDEIGQVLYNRGMLSAMLTVESIRSAQAHFGKKVMTAEQVQWGAEHLNIDKPRIKALGVEGILQPIHTSCSDHEGVRMARIHTWDGSEWSYTSDWYQADEKLLRPMIESSAMKYAAEKGIKPRDCAKVMKAM